MTGTVWIGGHIGMGKTDNSAILFGYDKRQKYTKWTENIKHVNCSHSEVTVDDTIPQILKV